MKSMKTTTNYSGMTDAEIIRRVIELYGINQTQLANRVYVTHASISRAIHGKSGLRPKIRQAMIDMLVEKDSSGSEES